MRQCARAGGEAVSRAHIVDVEVEVPVRDDARDDDDHRSDEADEEAHLKDLLVGDIEEEFHKPYRASVEAVHD